MAPKRWLVSRDPELVPVGYRALVDQYGLQVVPHHRESFLGRPAGTATTEAGSTRHIYSRSYAPREGLAGELEFALKYDGVNLQILGRLFETVGPDELTRYVRERPRSKYARRLWFLYEFLTGETLDVEDARDGAYVDLLDPDVYCTAEPVPSRRHRVRDNLLGDARFCPMVRRTPALAAYEAKGLSRVAAAVLEDYDADVIRRAVAYLYTKETKSSFLIEREKPSANRTERFVALLRRASELATIKKQDLVELQNATVDNRFRASDYRQNQNYVGESLVFGERVHYVSPKPGDVGELMAGLLDSLNRLLASPVDAVVAAAAVSFGFVFIHPFDDGNGRLHRFLIHFVLARRGFTPPGVIVPVSAVMLENSEDYDRCLARFSLPLMELVDYELDGDGTMEVRGETAYLYRYFDATPMAESLYGWVAETVEHDFRDELELVRRFDVTKRAIQEIVDLPDRLLGLFVRSCMDNEGALSARKREAHFAMLTDDEVARLEDAVREGMGIGAS